MNIKNTNNYYGDIFTTLKNELISLTDKIIKARETCNFGIYKNLILAYKEVLNLYRQITKDMENNLPPTNFHIHVENTTVNQTEELIEIIQKLIKKEMERNQLW